MGYNESGRRIDSTYIQGSPAKIRLGNKTLVPGKYSIVYYVSSSFLAWSDAALPIIYSLVTFQVRRMLQNRHGEF